ncbi:[protein-PII] uridylyltransferase [Salinisphaera hydrothermalis]|uniref:Bifunctional uridylyltransferase/uridylyl-removing enzyme n=1 Tax=Salinisphaera hydrothermalis (strain C41B8) TaxID=1304275 RepID=A0A084IK18_SALHC|nr:[protein-PII] uridylyltransferase [Salinisphaera hydrothermalis]KEZ77052.1 (Protein-PII) uridylyltransferase [Salinisphaera hydrothermalis C41B8]
MVTSQPFEEELESVGLTDWDAFLDRVWALDIGDAKSVRAALDEGQQYIADAFRHGESITRLVRARCEVVDAVLVHAWRELVATDSACLVAVGGYGRNELLPQSDIDLLVLYQHNQLDTVGPALEGFFTYLWDLGLEIGHSVRSPAECAELAADDITIMTNLMESRVLVGDPALFARMRATTSAEHVWSSADFFNAKVKEQAARHERYDETAYKLEPNVKESPGGLRDIQTIAWVAKRQFAAHTLDGLVDYGFLSRREFSELHRGQAFLWRVRFALHMLTGRNENRLLFDHQIQIAQLLGYHDAENTLAVERFMQRYYRNIKALSALNDVLLQLFSEAILHATDDERPRPINDRFQARHGFIEATHDKVFVETPSALLEIFYLMETRPGLSGIRARTLRLLRRDRRLIDDNFRNSIHCRRLFTEILRQRSGVTRALRRMNRYGILGRYLPKFGQIIGRMQYDLFHTLTVDEHTLFVIRNMRRLAIPRFNDELPFASELMQGLNKPQILYIAGLMHDIAKGRGGDHSELGAEDAREFCKAHGISSDDTELVCWLVRRHLLMSMTAQRRDINDVQVVNEFAREVGSRERLDRLFLLTICDIRATNPDLWNSWKESLLTDLYNNTRRALERGLDDPLDRDELIAETRSAAAAMLTRAGVNTPHFKNLWARFDPEYFLRHSPDEIARQTKAIITHGDDKNPLVSITDIPEQGTTLFVYTQDRDYLFGVTTGVLAQLGLSVLDARINTTSDDYTLDTYVIAEGDGHPIRDAYRRSEVESALVAAIADPAVESIDVTRRQGRRNQYFNVPTQIYFTQATERDCTVMEIMTADRPGLLSIIGDVFHRCGILLETAKIATIGERAEDVFFITDRQQMAIRDDDVLRELRDVMTAELDQSDS